MHIIISLVLALAACSKAEERPEPRPATDGAQAALDETTQRVQSFDDGTGFLVVRGPDGPKHHGDALWRTGLALAGLPCSAGAALEAGLARMIAALGGGLWRHPSLPDKVSLDQALSFYLAGASRLKRCGAAALAVWRPMLEDHRAFLAVHRNRLNPHASDVLIPPFHQVAEAVFAQAGVGPALETTGTALEAAVASWAMATRSAKAACYRVNLGLMSLRAVELAGGRVSEKGRGDFCHGIPNVVGGAAGLGLVWPDFYCGDAAPLDAFLGGFRWNRADFAFQRCPAWEDENDCEGDECPGIDRLMALREKYTFKGEADSP